MDICRIFLLFIFLTPLSTLIWVGASDSFTSIANLQWLALKEKALGQKLAAYLDSIKKQTDAIQLYLDELNKPSSISHPIDAFHLIKRLTINWDQVKEAVLHGSNITDKIRNEMMTISKSFPTSDDLSGAAFSLAQLQEAYHLNVSELASGYFTFKQQIFTSNRPLKSRDCLFIGKHAFNKGLYDQAVQWLQTAVQVAYSEGNETAGEIAPFLKTAIRVHDEVLLKKGPLGKDWSTRNEPYGRGSGGSGNRRRIDRKYSDSNRLATVQSTEWEEMQVFFKLCRGERLRPNSVHAKLKCRLVSHTHPYFILRPLKYEEHSIETTSSDDAAAAAMVRPTPYIVALHDFLSDAETELFKSLAVGAAAVEEEEEAGTYVNTIRLTRSQHAGKRSTSDKRTSKQSWVEDAEHATVAAISKRIERTIGLNSQPPNIGSEFYQVANYGIGGRYTPHLDYGVRSGNAELDSFRGDRICTFMVYLEDVEAGGATAFTHAGVVVAAEKKKAVLWWNLLSDGDGDLSTRHGGCPVLFGEKWIANKWFHSGQQMLKQPCSTRRHSRIAYP